MNRPSFIISTDEVAEIAVSYPESDEILCKSRAIGKAADLQRLGLHIQRLAPGHRTSCPHAEEVEEEFVYIISGEVDCWIDGYLHPMKAGDFVGFAAGTGIAHTILNNSDHEAVLFVGGEATKPNNRIANPLNPERNEALGNLAWTDADKRQLGGHPGLPKTDQEQEYRTAARPPYVITTREIEEKTSRYPESDEQLSSYRPIGKAAGLRAIGVHYERLEPDVRTCFPHAEEREEEFVYVLSGSVDAWINGHLYPLVAGDLVGFPAGTGIAHAILNNGAETAFLLNGGQASTDANRIVYPINPERKSSVGDGWWTDAPEHPLGPHDGIARAVK